MSKVEKLKTLMQAVNTEAFAQDPDALLSEEKHKAKFCADLLKHCEVRHCRPTRTIQAQLQVHVQV
jgi:hypothetical protein